MKTPTLPAAEMCDTDLVALCLAGNRNAFGQIVGRYQTLICSLAYSATGDLTLSEDLSQETFLVAWKQLPVLREPGKLRSWLCGIVRQLNYRTRRTQLREPVYGADRTGAAEECAAVEPLPHDQAISREEEVILWRALERVPANYREPLILFYREHQSVELVAQALDLSEEVVRQRLSRGRKLLQEEVAAFVEGALRKSIPGSAFAGGVLAAIPMNAAGVAAGTGAAKGGTLLSLITLPVLGLMATLAGCVWIIRDAATTGERQSRKRLIIAMWIVGAGLWLALSGSRWLRTQWNWSDRSFVASQLGCYLLWATIIVPIVVIYIRRYVATYAAILPNTSKRRPAALIVTCAMTFGALASVINVASQVGDRLSVGIISVVGLGVIGWSFCCLYFPNLITKLPVSPLRLAWVPTALVVGVILLILNWRLDGWIAVILGTDLAGAHLFLPMAMIHWSTFVLSLWIALLVGITKPKETSTPNPSHENVVRT
jgi:RNA polymerase sigma factor (sigma-70 family)